MKEPPSKSTFPLEQVKEMLRKELEEAADESVICHGGWEPVLDSLRMVTVVIDARRHVRLPAATGKGGPKGRLHKRGRRSR